MRRFINQSYLKLPPTSLVEMTKRCQEAGGINMGQGLCRGPIPEQILAATDKALRGDSNSYSYPEGIPDLRRAISDRMNADHGVNLDPETEVCATVGSTGGFMGIVSALLNPGDGVILLEPYYVGHIYAIVGAGLEPQYVVLNAPDFAIIEADLRAQIKSNTRAIVVCNPSNPSGKMITEEEFGIIAQVAEEHDLLVVTDEIYEKFCFDSRIHIPGYTIDGLRERTVTLGGPSKTLTMTGWRVGWALGPKALIDPIKWYVDLSAICPPTPLQWGLVEGMKLYSAQSEVVAKRYQKRRDWVCDALSDAGLQPAVPNGGIFVLANASDLGYSTALEAAIAVLEKTGVAACPGTEFYRPPLGDEFLRFCLAGDDNTIQEACNRLKKLRI